MKISVLTTTYNRCEELEKLYRRILDIIRFLITKLDPEDIKKIIFYLAKLFNSLIGKLTPEQLEELRKMILDVFRRIYRKIGKEAADNSINTIKWTNPVNI